jgi:hypothetical protein
VATVLDQWLFFSMGIKSYCRPFRLHAGPVYCFVYKLIMYAGLYQGLHEAHLAGIKQSDEV